MPHGLFMEIITSIPRFGSDEQRNALLSEIRSGIILKQSMEKDREEICAKHAKDVRNNAKNGFKGLRHLTVTPAWEWYNMRKKYGAEAMHDRGFIKDYQKKFSHLTVNKL